MVNPPVNVFSYDFTIVSAIFKGNNIQIACRLPSLHDEKPKRMVWEVVEVYNMSAGDFHARGCGLLCKELQLSACTPAFCSRHQVSMQRWLTYMSWSAIICSERSMVIVDQYVTGEIMENHIVKLYPEGPAEVRFKTRLVRKVIFYCNHHGLFEVRVKWAQVWTAAAEEKGKAQRTLILCALIWKKSGLVKAQAFYVLWREWRAGS